MWNSKAEIFKQQGNTELNLVCLNYDTTCEGACSGDSGIFEYYVNFTEGNGETTSTAGCNAITTHPVYTAENIATITTGTQLYNDPSLTTEFNGASKWYGVGATQNGPSNGKYQVNNSGVLQVKQNCPDYCCGDIVLNPSYFTGENANYFIQDCDTGSIVGYTVYYGEPAYTVYGRISCTIAPFQMSAIKSNGLDACMETVEAYTLYSYTPTLTVGVYLFEDPALLYVFQHGNIYIKDFGTGIVWRLNEYGKIISQFSCIT